MTLASGTLVRQWRDASVMAGWADAVQWWTPAVEEVAVALTDGQSDPIPACERLGRQRGAAGIFLDQARADLLVVADLAGTEPALGAGLVDSLTLGWVDRTLDDFFTAACVDPLTELTSMPYLFTRLREVYAEAQLGGTDPCMDYALVVARAAVLGDPIEAETQMITVQLALHVGFPGGETLTRIGTRCAVALVQRAEPRFGNSMSVLRFELQLAQLEQRLTTMDVWIQDLPARRSEVPALLREMNAVPG